jgi:hypothetical protein
MGEIIALRQMSGGEYDAARAAIGKRNDAKPKWDQELCKLFTASGWTTEALARKEGIHVRTMQQRLLFGRFVAIADKRAVAGGSSFLQGLTERRFRTYWRETVNTGNERQRFELVLKALSGPPIAARAIPATELFTKLSPIIEALTEYGTRHRVQDNPPAVAKLALDLRKLLDEWTK